MIRTAEILKLLRTWEEETEKTDWDQLARISSMLGIRNAKILDIRATIERLILQDILSEVRFKGPGMQAELSGWVSEPGRFALLIRAWGDFFWFQNAISALKGDLKKRWVCRTREDTFVTASGEKGILFDLSTDPPILSVTGEGAPTEGGQILVKIFSPEQIGGFEKIARFLKEVLEILGARSIEWGKRTQLLGDIYISGGIEGVRKNPYLPDIDIDKEGDWLVLQIPGNDKTLLLHLLFFLFPLQVDQLFAIREEKGFIRKRWTYSIRKFIHRNAHVSFEDDWVVVRLQTSPENLKKELERVAQFLEEEELVFVEGDGKRMKIWIKESVIERENVRKALNALALLL